MKSVAEFLLAFDLLILLIVVQPIVFIYCLNTLRSLICKRTYEKIPRYNKVIYFSGGGATIGTLLMVPVDPSIFMFTLTTKPERLLDILGLMPFYILYALCLVFIAWVLIKKLVKNNHKRNKYERYVYIVHSVIVYVSFLSTFVPLLLVWATRILEILETV